MLVTIVELGQHLRLKIKFPVTTSLNISAFEWGAKDYPLLKDNPFIFLNQMKCIGFFVFFGGGLGLEIKK